MAILVYVTAPSLEEADRIATALVDCRLAAGVNILPSVQSVYRWKGAICKAAEVVLVIKTEEACFPALADKIRELHSYETPCIVAVPITFGIPEFLDWIAVNTSPDSSPSLCEEH